MAANHAEYNWIEGVEHLEKYQPGGYHPIIIGDVLYDRYHVVDKLGFGGYSTVWLARDTRLERYVALKVNISQAIPREAKVLKSLTPSPVHSGYGLVPVFLDEFEVQGPNGQHTCYTVPHFSMTMEVQRSLIRETNGLRLRKDLRSVYRNGDGSLLEARLRKMRKLRFWI